MSKESSDVHKTWGRKAVGASLSVHSPAARYRHGKTFDNHLNFLNNHLTPTTIARYKSISGRSPLMENISELIENFSSNYSPPDAAY